MTTPSKEQASASQRISVGVWTEWVPGARWTNEGMTRLLGYIIEGAAQSEAYTFRIIMIDALRDEVREDLASLSATEGVDYTIECPNNSGTSNDFNQLADFANREVDVEGWIVLYPQFQHALRLKAPVAVIFPDGIPVAYPTVDAGAWGPAGYHVRWRDAVKTMLDGADRVITFSEHVARDHGARLFGVGGEKVCVVPHAPPDLQHLAPYAAKRQRTEESRRTAANLLRAYAAEKEISHLIDFPFEEVDYIAISTQDRVTKNIRIIAEAVRFLVREKRANLKMFMTAPIHFGATWTPLPVLLEREIFASDLISMTDLPRDVHAAFYHCAALAVHSSIFEGGRGVFPYYEAVSVGTPCLMGDGPHTRELVAEAPSLAPFVFDPNDAAGLAKLIQDVVRHRAQVHAVQLDAYELLSRRTWQDVARDYVAAAIMRDLDETSTKQAMTG